MGGDNASLISRLKIGAGLNNKNIAEKQGGVLCSCSDAFASVLTHSMRRIRLEPYLQGPRNPADEHNQEVLRGRS